MAPRAARDSVSTKTPRGVAPETKGNRHHASDSGVGSSSDRDSFAAYPDRPLTAQDYLSQTRDAHALHQELESAKRQIQLLTSRIQQLELDCSSKKSDNQALQAANRGLDNHAKILEEENDGLKSKIKRLTEDRDTLKHDNDILRENARLSRNAAPRKSGPETDMADGFTSGPKPETSKLGRRESKMNKGRHDAEADALRERFNRIATESAGPSRLVGTGTSSRRRRDSYIESWGPDGGSSEQRVPAEPAFATLSQQFPPRVSRSYATYATTQLKPAAVSAVGATQYSQIPRSSQIPSYATDRYSDEADRYGGYPATGDYVAKPLPKEHRHRPR